MKKFFLVGACLGGILLAVLNWYFVDPLNIRALPAVFRYLLSAGMGGLGGALVGLLLQKTWGGKIGWVECLSVIALAAFLWWNGQTTHLAPAYNQFSTSLLSIKGAGVLKNSADAIPVTIRSVTAGDREINLSQCALTGRMEWSGTRVTLLGTPTEPAQINCVLLFPQGTPVRVLVEKQPGGGAAEIALDGELQSADTQGPAGENAEINAAIAFKSGFLFASVVEGIDLLLLACVLVGIGRKGIVELKRLDKAKTTAMFNTWFEETSERFIGLLILLFVVSALLTGVLFFEPGAQTGGKTGLSLQSTSQKPNVVIFVIDAMSAEDMSLYGYDLPTTPNLDRLAKNWTVYENNHSAATCSVGILPVSMTGRYPYTEIFSRYGDNTNRQADWINLAQEFKDAGYQTWWQGYLTPGYYHLGNAFDHMNCPISPIMDTLARRRFQPRAFFKGNFPYVPLGMQFAQVALGDDYMECDDPADYSAFQGEISPEPFFMFLHISGAHVPYEPGQFLGTFLPVEAGMTGAAEQSAIVGRYPIQKQALVDKMHLRYDEDILRQDQIVSKFIDLLKEKGLYENTMIAILADHGANFGHGMSTHCTRLVSQGETHVPLLIKYPGQSEGKRLNFLTSSVDLAPTILDEVGFNYPAQNFDGVSLLKLEQNPQTDRIVLSRILYHAEYPVNILAAISDHYRLILREGRTFVLYDYVQDPEENNNLYPQSEQKSETQRLRSALESYLGSFVR